MHVATVHCIILSACAQSQVHHDMFTIIPTLVFSLLSSLILFSIAKVGMHSFADHPFCAYHQLVQQCLSSCRPGKVLASVAVLGRQKLTVLRDTIKCEADATLTKNNKSRPSACLYFEVYFWPDMLMAMVPHMTAVSTLPFFAVLACYSLTLLFSQKI